MAILDGYMQPQMSMVFTAFVGEYLDLQDDLTNTSDSARASGGMYAINSY